MFIGIKRPPINVILLALVTCGIYGIYWNYTTANEINSALGRDAVNPVLAIVGSLCFPVFWLYLKAVDPAMQEINTEVGKPAESRFLMWLLLSLVGIGMYLYIYQVQTDLNDLWDARSNNPAN